MTGITHLTAEHVRAWARESVGRLKQSRERLDAANVFPVADSDTGTNMWLTLSHGAEAITARQKGDDAVGTLRSFASGASAGARGNSGVILGEFLRGLAIGAAARHPAQVSSSGRAASSELEGRDLVAGLIEGADRARAAVARPVPGTILSAAGEAAAAAAAVLEKDSWRLSTLIDAAVAGARKAVDASPDQLSALRTAHVVDSGAVGLLLVLEGLQSVVNGDTGRDVTQIPLSVSEWSASVIDGDPDQDCQCIRRDAGQHRGPAADHGGILEGPAFEVMYLAERGGCDPHVDEPADAVAASRLQSSLTEIGDSVVVGSPGDREDRSVRVHVHTDDPAAAIAVALGWQLSQVVVHRVSDPVADRPWGVVGITSSPRLLSDIAALGGVALWSQTGAIADAELRRAIVDAHGREVLVISGRIAEDPSLAARAEKIGWHCGVRVHSLRGRNSTDAHLIAALAAVQLASGAGADEAADRAAEAIRHVQVTILETDGSQADLPAALADIHGQLGAATDTVTLICDEHADPSVPETVVQWARAAGLDVVRLPSGVEAASCVVGVE